MSKSTNTNGTKRFDKLKKLLNRGQVPSVFSPPESEEIVVVDTDVITLVASQVRADGPMVVCTCGWSLGPSTALYALGVAARDHQDETGHRLRSH